MSKSSLYGIWQDPNGNNRAPFILRSINATDSTINKNYLFDHAFKKYLFKILLTEYENTRNVLLENNWTPKISDSEIVDLRAKDFYNRGIVEIADCSGFGLAPCRFELIDLAGNLLVIITLGEEGSTIHSMYVKRKRT